MTDGELVRRVVAGETAAYGVLARRWFCRILAFCQSRSSVVGLHDAEDLTQDVLVRGFRNLDSLVEPDQFGPWLRGIARHACADRGRDRKRQPQPVEDLEWLATAGTGMPFESACINDERLAVLEQIASIPEELREVILLHYYENLTYDEMARWLGVARATVNDRLARARELLRIRLAKLRSHV